MVERPLAEVVANIPRISSAAERGSRVPVHVVWELTLACDLRCRHCGSRAGRPRPNELTTAECLEVIGKLSEMGAREISLIGGEAYLRKDLPVLVRAIVTAGMYCGIQTGGRNFTDTRLNAVSDAGLGGLGVSLDGTRELHDWLRGVPGSYDAALSLLRRARARGLRTSVNTQVGSRTIPELPVLLEAIADAGATHWQVQLTVAMGNAADNPELLLQPYQVNELMPLLVDLYHRGLERGVLLEPGNNIGYFGPFEHIWREATEGKSHWSGCEAGETSLGLEADGTIKGCPSLATIRYRAGNIRDVRIDEAWKTSPVLRQVRPELGALWGFCATCYYAPVCSAGCTWMTDSLLGRAGNNPYCHHRALELSRQGLRERVAPETAALPTPFGTGLFRIVLEDLDGRPIDVAPPADRTVRPEGTSGTPVDELVLCGSCLQFVYAGSDCAFCGAELASATAKLRDDRSRRAAIVAAIELAIEPRASGDAERDRR